MEQEVTSLNIEKSKAISLDKQGLKDFSINGIENDRWKAPITKTASKLYEEECKRGSVLSFVDELDALLGEEIVAGSITEFAGLPGSGKTQLCLQLCASVQLPRIYGGAKGAAVYIGTNKNFNRERLQEIIINCCEKFNTIKGKNLPETTLTSETMLNQIYYIEATNCTQLLSSFKSLEDFLPEKNIKLLIVDSVSYPLRQIVPENRAKYSARIFNDLRHLGDKFECAVVVTNDMTTRIRNSDAYETPSFGDSFYHQINTRIILSRTVEGFKAEIIKSRYQEPRFVQFSL